MEGHDPRRNIQEPKMQDRDRLEPPRHEQDLGRGPESTRLLDQESVSPTRPEVLPQNPEAIYTQAKQNYHEVLESREQHSCLEDWHIAIGKAQGAFEQSFESLPRDIRETLVPANVKIKDLLGNRGDVSLSLPELVVGAEGSMRLQGFSDEIQMGQSRNSEYGYRESISGYSLNHEKLADDWVLTNQLMIKPGSEVNHLVWACGRDQGKQGQQVEETARCLNEAYKAAIEHGDARTARALEHFDRECGIGRYAKRPGEFLGTHY